MTEPRPDGRPADLIVTGGRVDTRDPGRPTAEAVAARDGRFVAVGAAREVDALRGPSTRVVDLRGGMAVPGFGDAHVHPIHGGLAMIRCELHSDTYEQSLDGYLGIIAAYAAANPDQAWIRGGGWSMGDFPNGTPRREDLDRIVPDRPVFLPNRDGHSAWVNTLALEVAGVTNETADPYDGRIERDPDGTATGSLHDGAMDLVEEHIPPDTADELIEGLRAGQRYMHERGLTAWQDAIVGPTEEVAYRALGNSGELTARVVGALWWDRYRGLEQIDELVERRARGPAGRYRPTSVKIMQDGVLETFTGAMIEPYLGRDGRPTTNRGPSMVDPAVLNEAVTRLDRAGFQVHFHAIGDRAVRECLDAVEAARRASGPSDNRHHIAHIQVIHPADIARFARLDVVANAQPLWAIHEVQLDELTIPYLGPARSAWQYPFASLLRAGARLAMGSDWSVSTPNPLIEMEHAVTRVAWLWRGKKEPFLPEERLTLEQALAGFTTGTAFVNHTENETGSIEVGKLADLAILDRDLFAPDVGPIGDARVLATIVGGEFVYEADGFGG
ncbi:MAG: amidohydrolase [Chloroflexota bacterium]